MFQNASMYAPQCEWTVNEVSSMPFTTVRTGVTKMTCSWMPKRHSWKISLLKSVNIRDEFSVANERIDTVTTAKFLGVTIDYHLTFQSHVTERITKAHKLAYILVKLKRVRIPTEDLIEIYRARILSLPTYAVPAWFTHISLTLITNPERVQKLCLEIIVPGEEGYEDHLRLAKLTTVETHMQKLCQNYLQKIFRNPKHRLHNLIPYKP